MACPPLRALLVAAAICGTSVASPATVDADPPLSCYEMIPPTRSSPFATLCVPLYALVG